MTAGPVLETERLILRQFLASDLDAFRTMLNEPAVLEFTYGKPVSREQAWAVLLRHRGMWAVAGFGYMAVEEKATGLLVGECGMQERMRAIDPPVEGSLEAGWKFSTASQGKGYAREAMRAIMDWCDEVHPDKTMSCLIDERNERSIRLAAALGFREAARTDYESRPMIVYWRERETAPARIVSID